MEWDTPENYERRRKRLVELMATALRDIPQDGPFTKEQREQLRELVVEKSELLHRDVYNDSFSRNNLWLYGNYLAFNNDEARVASLAFSADPSLRNSELGIAFEKYLDMVQRGQVNDPYVEAWLKKNE
jgi:hypothetical protein